MAEVANPADKTESTAAAANTKPCSGKNCGKPATSLKCPVCVKLNLPPRYFCSQDCFKTNYRLHNARVHLPAQERIKREEGLKKFRVPKFDYTGPLRPSYVTPMRKIPNTIGKPDYAETGIPRSEMRAKSTKQIPIYTASEIAGIRTACRLGREVLDIAGNLVKPGITTEEIDIAVHNACIARKCYPSPLNYHHFPKSCCTSVNEIICHGIPDCRPLEKGDIVNIDITVYKDGYHGDLNETFIVGDVKDIKPEDLELIKTTYEATMNAINHVKPGVMCRKFGEIIDNYVKKKGLSVTRTYCGHGIGKLFHCSPNIPHYKRNKAVGKLKANMVFTIEPMINMGTWKDKTWSFDNWTAVTMDGKRSAQFEHTVLVTHTGVEILTARTANSVPLWWERKDNDEAKGNEPEDAKPATENQSAPKDDASKDANNTQQNGGDNNDENETQ